jgi:hypothetical protein
MQVSKIQMHQTLEDPFLSPGGSEITRWKIRSSALACASAAICHQNGCQVQ